MATTEDGMQYSRMVDGVLVESSQPIQWIEGPNVSFGGGSSCNVATGKIQIDGMNCAIRMHLATGVVEASSRTMGRGSVSVSRVVVTRNDGKRVQKDVKRRSVTPTSVRTSHTSTTSSRGFFAFLGEVLETIGDFFTGGGHGGHHDHGSSFFDFDD